MEFIIPNLASAEVWISLLTLTFLEIVLGIDNIIFISISAGKLPEENQKKATNIGLALAMILRIVLLFGLAYLTHMQKPLFEIHNSWLDVSFSVEALLLIVGGIFLLYKSTTEIHHKLDIHEEEHNKQSAKKVSLSSVIVQITIINIVFSFDSILTAVGMTSGLHGALVVMVSAVVVSVIIMMLFANPVGRFVNKNPTIQMLGLSFLLLIGFMLIVEGAHKGHAVIFGAEVGTVPKAYLYFAIAFSLFVEFLNMRLRKNNNKVNLTGPTNEASEKGLL